MVRADTSSRSHSSPPGQSRLACRSESRVRSRLEVVSAMGRDCLALRTGVGRNGRDPSRMRTDDLRGLHVEIELTHPAAAFAAMTALDGMADGPLHADHVRVHVPVAERAGAIMEAARRLSAAGVGVVDLELRAPAGELTRAA